jgi:hypothetical protein
MPNTTEAPQEPIYYHGSSACLQVGDMLLPPSETGKYVDVNDCNKSSQQIALALRHRMSKMDHVFISTDFFMSLGYTHGETGRVYRVCPDGPLTPDPDGNWPFQPPVAFWCKQACVLEVIQPTPEHLDILHMLNAESEVSPVSARRFARGPERTLENVREFPTPEPVKPVTPPARDHSLKLATDSLREFNETTREHIARLRLNKSAPPA